LAPRQSDFPRLPRIFIANIYFYDIDTPLKQYVAAHPNLVRHCQAIHKALNRPPS